MEPNPTLPHDNLWLQIRETVYQSVEPEPIYRACEAAKGILESHPPGVDCIECNYYLAAILTDAGRRLSDQGLVEAGVAVNERLLTLVDSDDTATYHEVDYNLSVGYGLLASMYQDIGDSDRAETYRRKEIGLLQGLMLREDTIQRSMLSKVRTNYANVICEQGRLIEAIDYYLLAVRDDPSMAMAVRNCADAVVSLMSYLDYFHESNVVEAWLLSKAVEEMQDEIIDISGIGALQAWRERHRGLLAFIEEGFEGGLEALLTWNDGERMEDDDELEIAPIQTRISHDRLLLTLHVNPRQQFHELRDLLLAQLLYGAAPVTTQGRSERLHSALSDLVDDFVTARYCYYMAEDWYEEMGDLMAMTDYNFAIPGVAFGLPGGLLRASFRMAADCFDKIAGVLNYYFEFGMREEQVSFARLIPRGTVGTQTKLGRKRDDNVFVRALYHLRQDSPVENWPTNRVRSIRNAVTHRNHLLFWDGETVEGVAANETVEGFRNETLFLLRTTKAAIIYLVGAIIIEENSRRDTVGESGAPDIKSTPGSFKWTLPRELRSDWPLP